MFCRSYRRAIQKMNYRRLFESALSFGVSFFLAWVLVIKADPFGFDATSKAYAENLFYRVVGSIDFMTRILYSDREHGADYGQKNIALVLLQDDDLKFTGASWPAPFGLHDRVIRNILDYRPKAIFVDISFTDPRRDSSINAFAKTVQRSHEIGIPIYFASLEPFDDKRKILPELASAYARVVPAYKAEASEDGVEHRYLLSYQRPDANVVVSNAGSHCSIAESTQLDSPAIALYREHLNSMGKALDIEQFCRPMEVFWASGTIPEINRRFMGCEKKTVSSVFSYATKSSWIQLPWDLLTGNKSSELKQACPHTPTVYVKDLLETGHGDQEAQELFGGKLVIYGANIKGSGDEIVVPTHEGRVPGAFLHAMALDNLMVFGENYKSENNDWEWLILGALSVLFLVVRQHPDSSDELLYVAFDRPINIWGVIKRVTQEAMRFLMGKVGSILKWVVLNVLLVIPVIFICCYVAFKCGNVAPLNWVKFIGFAFSYEFIEAGLGQSKRVENFFNWLAALIAEENKKGASQ